MIIKQRVPTYTGSSTKSTQTTRYAYKDDNGIASFYVLEAQDALMLQYIDNSDGLVYSLKLTPALLRQLVKTNTVDEKSVVVMPRDELSIPEFKFQE